jgi:hypothetical protein
MTPSVRMSVMNIRALAAMGGDAFVTDDDTAPLTKGVMADIASNMTVRTRENFIVRWFIFL